MRTPGRPRAVSENVWCEYASLSHVAYDRDTPMQRNHASCALKLPIEPAQCYVKRGDY